MDKQKRKAAERAVEYVTSGMRVGLGTGSTAWHVVEVIAERLAAGRLKDIVGIPTSRATDHHARERGIPLTTLEEVCSLDLTIDGADEIGPGLDLIKGHGGALLWEKIVACASSRLIIVADRTKLVKRLGARMALPVEVVPFGWSTHVAFLYKAGARPLLRRVDEEPVMTDSGNFLIDCHFDRGIEDPVGVDTAFKARVGIIETGLFIGMADTAIVADDRGVRVIERAVAP
ncbi:MAG: ribose-5-phosphate isomerase RpiA [Gemmatimonadetes bacterium]|nr:ribose-5-phosphate isomerase RpiA [Gemmatimonadota bacterium]